VVAILDGTEDAGTTVRSRRLRRDRRPRADRGDAALAARLEGLRLVVVNSTQRAAGSRRSSCGTSRCFAKASSCAGDRHRQPAYFAATKRIHNALQGGAVDLTPAQRSLRQTVRANAERLARRCRRRRDPRPQPAPLISFAPKTCPWVWRCHIDASRPFRPVWKF
jgi:trehalose synthase